MPVEFPCRADVCAFIAQRASRRHAGHDLSDDLPLGAAGLGLDSVGIVELLLASEDAFGTRVDATILERGPLTVGALIVLIQRAAHVDP